MSTMVGALFLCGKDAERRHLLPPSRCRLSAERRDSVSRGRHRALVAAEQILQAAAFLAALLRCPLLLFPRICFASAREP